MHLTISIKKYIALALALSLLVCLIPMTQDAQALTGTTLGTSSNATPTKDSYLSHGPFYANGYYYVFWYDGTNMVSASSADLTTWNAKQTAAASVPIGSFAVAVAGSTFHLAYISGNAIIYKQGVADAGGAITYDTPQTVNDGTTGACTLPTVSIGSDSHAWVGYKKVAGAVKYLYAVRNANPTSSPTWTATVGFPVQAATYPGDSMILTMCPTPDGGQFFVYSINSYELGTRICAIDGTMTAHQTAGTLKMNDARYYGAASSGNVLFVAFVTQAMDLVFLERSAGGVWSSPKTIVHVTAGNVPVLTSDGSGNVWIFYEGYPTLYHIYYSSYINGVWADNVDWLNEATEAGLTVNNIMGPQAMQNGNLLLAYTTKTSNPYNVKIAFIATEQPPTGWKPTITSTPATTGTVGAAYTYTPTTNETSTITAPTLPAWATYAAGQIAGTPTEAGTFAFSVHAVSTAGTLATDQYWNVTVSPAPTWKPTFSTEPPTTGTVGTEYSYTPECNETVSYDLDTAPVWAGLVDGAIIGLPNEAGTYDFSLIATSAAGTLTETQTWQVVIIDPKPVFLNAPTENGTKRVWYSWTAQVDQPVTMILNSNAGWLKLNPFTGELYGLPTEAGTFWISINATNDNGISSVLAFNLTIADWLGPGDTGTDEEPITPGTQTPDTILGLTTTQLTIGLLVLIVLLAIIIAARRR